MAYYAICNVNGPISVELNATTTKEAVEEFNKLNLRELIDDPSVDLEDFLDINGDGMSEDQFEEAIKAAGATYVGELSDDCWGGGHVNGSWYLWLV
jgi:hypothetical protein